MTELPYQAYFCEENAWQLCRRKLAAGEDGSSPTDLFAIFISNHQRACPLWNQRAAPAPDRPVFWDYHVVVLEICEGSARIWDQDSTLGCPVPFEQWRRQTFPHVKRLLPAGDYVEKFSSDRSHMRADGQWKKPPPAWDPIFDPERGMNLEEFVDVERSEMGERYTLDDLTGFVRDACDAP